MADDMTYNLKYLGKTESLAFVIFHSLFLCCLFVIFIERTLVSLEGDKHQVIIRVSRAIAI